MGLLSFVRRGTIPALLVLLTACSGGGSQNGSVTPAATVKPDLSGTSMGGRQPIIGATVTAYAISTTSGTAPTQLGTATTDSKGSFAITFGTTPAVGQEIYLTSTGGDAGGGSNTAIAMISVVGAWCTGSTCTFPAAVNVNEFSTVASAYAFQQQISHVACSSITGNTLTGTCPAIAGGSGVAIASQLLGNLLSVADGKPSAYLPTSCSTSTGNCGTLEKMNTLANLLASCINSNGATTACTSLLADTSNASDTLTAAQNVATVASVRNNGSTLFGLLSPVTVYAPELTSAPTDWTLSFTYTGGGLTQPAGLAIDSTGNAWVSDSTTTGAVSKFSPAGVALSPSAGYTGGGLSGPQGVAVDASNNVWIANWASGSGTTVTKLSSTGAVAGPTKGYTGGSMLGPISLAVDSSGNVWIANFGNSSVSEILAAGTVTGPYKGGGIDFPTSLALDALGDIWVSNSSGNSTSEYSSSATAISSSSGYTSGSLDYPYAIAIDPSGNAWVANYFNNSLTHQFGGNTPPSSCPTTPATGSTGCAMSTSAYTGGGLSGPAGLAVDSAGNVWVSNYHGSSISGFSSTGAALSTTAGYAASTQPYGIAVDAAGNVWVANYGGNAVTEFIGLAAPTKTPLQGLPKAP